MYRCMSTVVSAPNKQNNILIVFGGNPNCQGAGQFALAIDLKDIEKDEVNFIKQDDKKGCKKVYGKNFGNEQFKREVFVNDDVVLSEFSNVVDLQGVRSQNFSEWLCVIN